MVVVNVGVWRGVTLSNDPLDDLVAVELLRQSLLVDLERLEVFSRRRLVRENALTSCPDRLDVVLDTLEALETFEILVRLPSVVYVRVALPLDEEAQVDRRYVLGVPLYYGSSVSKNLRKLRWRLTVLSVAFVVIDAVDRVLGPWVQSRALAGRSNSLTHHSPVSSAASGLS